MNKELPDFQQYQLAFTQHLRDPKVYARPKGVAAKGIAVYEDIVFNNLYESVSACFPVAQKVLGKRAWLKLTRGFLRDHAADSPIFRKIPEEFLSYLSTQPNLPLYLNNLCHYEWVELAVSVTDAAIELDTIDSSGHLLQHRVVFNPAMQLLHYNYDVQKISPRYKPKSEVSTQLLVYRNTQDVVKFMELNPVTYRLIGLLQEGMTGEKILMLISIELGYIEPDDMMQFGLEILQDFKRLGIILGVHSKT